MTNTQASFNLVDEPWILVRDRDGRVREVSLLEVFKLAPVLRGLAGEVATQDIAILRLLEAVLLGATRTLPPRHTDESEDLWARWWQLGSFPDDIAHYLMTNRDHFYLLHPTDPFMQVAGLHTESGKTSGLVKLIADVPDGQRYFTTRAGKELESLSFAEAARWLVHCHAFDPAGIKTGAVGDSRVKGGKGYSMGYPAWCGNLGIVIAEGSSLFQTLMFNCPLALVGHADDVPLWERGPLKACVASEHPMPLGPADLLTWPSRRILLHSDGDRIVEVQISNGDPLGPQNQAGNEPMAAWRMSAPQSKKAGHEVYMPVLHSPDRRVWQGLAGLLITAQGESESAWVLRWLGKLQYDEVLPTNQQIHLRAVGFEYGPQASSIAGLVDDSLHAYVSVLTDPVLVRICVDAAKRASDAVVALANLASNLALAIGGESERPRARTFEFGYSLLDVPYRNWIVSLRDRQQADKALEDWSQTVRTILVEAAYQLIDDAGPLAQIGRPVLQHGSEDKKLLDAALAEIWFRAALSRALGTHSTPVQPQEVSA